MCWVLVLFLFFTERSTCDLFEFFGFSSDQMFPSFSRSGLHRFEDPVLSTMRGDIAAFGDFDSDLFMDLIVISKNNSQIDVFLWDRNSLSFTPPSQDLSAPIPLTSENSYSQLAASDFNHDGRLDVLVWTISESMDEKRNVRLLLYFGFNSRLCKDPLWLPSGVGSAPLVMEANGDLFPDLYGQAGGAPQFWVNDLASLPPKCFDGEQASDEEDLDCGGTCLPCQCFGPDAEGDCGFRLVGAGDVQPHAQRSSLFADMDGDCLPDLVTTSADNRVYVWFNAGVLSDPSAIQAGDVPLTFLDQSVWRREVLLLSPTTGSVWAGDIDRDGRLDLAYLQSDPLQGASIRVALGRSKEGFSGDSICQRDSSLVWGEERLEGGREGTVAMDALDMTGMRFLATQDLDSGRRIVLDPLLIRAGDIDLDGFPDLIIPLVSIDSFSLPRVTVWMNRPGSDKSPRRFARVACSDHDAGCPTALLDTTLGAYAGALIDLNERGGADLLILYDDGRAEVMLTNLAGGNMFLKAMALNGVCMEWCYDGGEIFPDPKPFGVNQVGATIKLNTRDLSGSRIAQQACQLSRSSHGALETPYVTLGLGDSGVFVETLAIGVPLVSGDGHYNTWMGLIPNSQLVASPTDTSPAHWLLHAWVRPSGGVLYVSICLAASLVILSVFILYLQRREKQQDGIDKQLTAHAFI